MADQPTPKTYFKFQTVTKTHFDIHNGNSNLNSRFHLSPDIMMIYFFLHIPFIVLTISLWFFYISALQKGLSNAGKTLKDIPAKKYKNEDKHETCSICLDTLLENADIRILRCKHLYHVKCIDPWLYKRISCPLCRLSPDKLQK